MMIVRISNYRWGLLATSLALLQVSFGGSPANGQQGIFLTGLGESAQNVDVTESGGNPTATVTITCCQPDGVTPVTPQHGTQGEAVENLINDLVIFAGTPPNLTKWNDLQGDLFMIPVELRLDQQRAVNYYTLTSANDSPERDPWEWRFLGSNVENPTPADFTLIDTRTEVDFPNRHQTQLFGPLGNTTAYRTYRFEFETQYVAQGAANYPPGLAIPNSIQAAEVELFVDFAGGGAKLTIDRGSSTTPSTMALTNAGTSAISILGYSITSPGGTLNSNTWLSITDNYDGNNGGSLDSDNWIRLTEPNSRRDLSEVENPNGTNGVTLAPSASINLGSNVWIKHPTEDVSAEILLSDGTTQTVAVAYTGGAAYRFGDLNFDRNATLTASDWAAFKNGQGFNFSTVFSAAESYAKGDLDGDFDHDLDDYARFKLAYDAANGAGAFVAMLAAVPEPSAALLIGIATLFAVSASFRRRGALLALIGLSFVLMAGQTTQAGQVIPNLLGSDLTDPDNVAPIDVTVTAGDQANSPMAEMPPMAVDNSRTTKWLAFQPNGTFYQLQFNGGVQQVVNAYTISSANDAAERDPYAWTLSGSNDGTNFTVVDTQTNQDFVNRFETQLFSFSNSQAFNIYKFDFQTALGAGVPNAPGTNSIQLSEIELFRFADPLSLEVNRATGTIRIANNDPTDPVPMDAYRIRSAAGSLNRNNWWGAGPAAAKNGGQSIHDQTITGFPSGIGTGNGWEEGPGSTNNELVEWFLGSGAQAGQGSSTLAPATAITMLNVYQTGSAQDLLFDYRSGGRTVQGVVQYIGTPIGVTGDYNGNGTVDAADYVLWRKGGPLQNDTTPGVQPEDYGVWRANFGRTAGSGSSLAAVPEPATWLLSLIVPGILLGARKRATTRGMHRDQITEDSQSIVRRSAMADKSARETFTCVIVLAAIGLFMSAAPALASTVDRNYRFGDDPQENAVVGQVVGQASVVPNHTLDSASQGSFFDILQHSNPTYVNTQATSRPGAATNEKGIQFTGSSSQYLDGPGFGAPREGGALANPPISDYASSRIMQVWARPTVDTGARQDIVNDTFQFGIHITPSDTWGHTYGATDGVGNDFNTGAPVAYNQWTHIMQRTFDAGGVAVYINGVAVSRFNAGYVQTTGAGDNRNIYVGGGLGGASNFFTGQLDNLKLAVAGIFIPQPPNQPIPVDWGAFSIGTENEFIASRNLVTGDVNGDGVVNGTGTGPAATDDVRFFIDHWLDERRVNNILIGDLTSRTTLGDLNFDGRTTLADWSILRNAHASGANLDLGALLAGVPEPSTAALSALAALAMCGRARRRRD